MRSRIFKSLPVLFVLPCLLLTQVCFGQRYLLHKCDSSITVKTGVNEVFICKKLQETGACPAGVFVRIKNTGAKPISKYILTDRDDNSRKYLFDGLAPGDSTGYQCIPSINVPFDNDLEVVIQNGNIEYADLTQRGTVWDNVLKKGKVTLDIGVDYDDTVPFDIKELKKQILYFPVPETMVDN